MSEKMIDNDLCLNCGSTKTGSLDASADCPECGYKSGVHQWMCDGCGSLIGMTIDDDHQRPEKLLCPECMDDCTLGETPVEESVIQEDEAWFSEETVCSNESSQQENTVWSGEQPQQENTVWTEGQPSQEGGVWESEQFWEA